jgi:hypothetical protein
MNRHPFALARRKALAGFGLALFLMGTNYCLVGALQPASGMACMAPVRTASAQGASSGAADMTSHCARHASAATQENDAPPAAPSAPCCIALTTVTAPEVGKVAPGIPVVLPCVIEEDILVSAPSVPGHLLLAPPGESFTSLHLSAPNSSRAPPLA